MFPLSAGKTRIPLFLFKLPIACRFFVFTFETLGGFAFFRMLQTSLLTSSLESRGRFDMLCSTMVTISLTGTYLGITAKFIPFLSSDISLASRLWSEVFTTHLFFIVSCCCFSVCCAGFSIIYIGVLHECQVISVGFVVRWFLKLLLVHSVLLVHWCFVGHPELFFSRRQF